MSEMLNCQLPSVRCKKLQNVILEMKKNTKLFSCVKCNKLPIIVYHIVICQKVQVVIYQRLYVRNTNCPMSDVR